MTLTVEPAAPTAATVPHRSSRELLDHAPGLFDRLAAYLAKDLAVTLPYAEQVMEQTLIWLKACADNPTQRVGMSEAVDHGWHAFLLHSQHYAEFCDRMFGRYLHHVPPAPGRRMTYEEVTATLPALHATGYPVDQAFWDGPGYGCCPPNPCTAKPAPPTRQPSRQAQPDKTGTSASAPTVT